jgi:hypothetical protein
LGQTGFLRNGSVVALAVLVQCDNEVVDVLRLGRDLAEDNPSARKAGSGNH